jgi:hypothetical protein
VTRRADARALGELAMWSDDQLAAFHARRAALEAGGLTRSAASVEAFRQLTAEVTRSTSSAAHAR